MWKSLLTYFPHRRAIRANLSRFLPLALVILPALAPGVHRRVCLGVPGECLMLRAGTAGHCQRVLGESLVFRHLGRHQVATQLVRGSRPEVDVTRRVDGGQVLAGSPLGAFGDVDVQGLGRKSQVRPERVIHRASVLRLTAHQEGPQVLVILNQNPSWAMSPAPFSSCPRPWDLSMRLMADFSSAVRISTPSLRARQSAGRWCS